MFNVWSRTQQFGFALPLAPDFKEAATPYAIASIGGIGGAMLLSAVSAGLWFYATRMNRSADGWLGRVPSISKELRPSPGGHIPALLQVFVLVVTLAFPLVMQLHFVDKYLSGTSTNLDGTFYANSWQGHLLSLPPHACQNFLYDGKASAAYCEFFEPWLVVISAFISVCAAAIAMCAVILPLNQRR